MARSKRLVKKARSKRSCVRNNGPPSHTTFIKALPRDMLVEVVAIVGSHSFADLHKIKVCCKDFLDAAEDSYVWRRVSLNMFPLIQWLPNDKASWFLNRCRECENVESIYREGLRKYFISPNGKIDGLEMLKVAAQKNHKEAKYMCGMILLCSEDDELRKQGLEHMRFLRKSKCVVSCRNKVKRLLIDFIWRNNSILVRNLSPLCNFKSTCKEWKVKTSSWILVDDDDDVDDINLCEHCRWDHELEFSYKLFNGH